MENDKVKTIVASFLIVGSALSLYLFFHDTPPLGDRTPHEAVGQVLAEQAAKLLGSGGTVTLIARDISFHPSPATLFQLKGFADAAKSLKLTVTTTNLMKLDPLRPVRVPPGDFLDILRKRNDGDVVVSFLGPPTFGPDQRALAGDKKVAVVAFCPGDIPRQIDLRGLFETAVLQAAIINRPDPPMVQPPTGDKQAWFRHFYEVVTPVNLSDLPLPKEGGNR